MKNKINLNQLSMSWNEKQKPQRFARYAAMLIMLLTISVGQMWAAWYVQGSGTGLNGWGGGAQMTQSNSNTNVYYRQVSGYCEFKITSNSSGYDNERNGSHIDNTLGSFNLSGSTGSNISGNGGDNWYICYNTSSQKVYGTTVVSYYPDLYLGGDNSWISKEWNTTDDANKLSRSSNTYTIAINSVSANVDHKMKIAAYGWGQPQYGSTAYNSSGSKNINSKSADNDGNKVFQTYVAGDVIITLDYSAGTFTLYGPRTITLDQQGATTQGTTSVSATYGAATSSISTPSKTGYTFGGFYTSTGGGGSQVIQANGSWKSSVSNYTSSGKYAATANKTIYAKWTQSVKLHDNNGDVASGSVTATYNSTGAFTPTAPTKTGYHVEGYYAEPACTNKVMTDAGALVNYSGYVSSGKWIHSGATTLYAKWVGNTYYVSYNANGGTGSMSNSTHTYGTASNLSDCTLTPPSGKTFAGWATSDDGSVVYANGASVSTLATSGTYPLYAKWDDLSGGSVTLNAGTGGKVSKDNSNWSATVTITDITSNQVVNIYAQPNMGYTFNSWTKTSGSGSVKTNSASGDYNAIAYATDVVAASFNETMSSLSTSCHYDAGNPSYAAPTVSNSATNVGYVTTRTITAPAAGTGYTFVGWTLTNCTRTDGNGATDNPITIRSNGDGAAVTVVANYEEDLSSDWEVRGGSQFGSTWSANTNAMEKKTGHADEDVVYFTVTTTGTNTGNSNGDYQFKIYNDNLKNKWWGLSDSYKNYIRTTGTQTLSNANNIELRADVVGDYEIKVDYSDIDNPEITITFPTKYSVTYSVSPSGAAGAITTSPSISSGNDVTAGTSITFTHAAANTGYTWYRWENGSGSSLGTGSTYTATINANTTVVAKYNENTYNVTVTKNTGGSVTPTTVTAMGQVNGGSITATPNTGYNFTNWTITSGTGYFGTTGTSTSTTTANTKFRPTAAATITATFTAKQYTITLDGNGGAGNTESVKATYNSSSLSTGITNPTRTGYTFNGWHKDSGTGQLIISTAGALQATTSYTNGSSQWTNDGAVTLYAGWTPKTTDITLDQTGAASSGSVTTRTGTYNADMPAITGSGSLPTAPQGYAFMGYWDDEDGEGNQYYNADGTSARTWNKEDASFTLHPYFKRADITALTVSPSTVAPGAEVLVTPTIDPIPAGTMEICWKLFHSNDNLMEDQPTFTQAPDNGVRFNAPEVSSTYKIACILRTGNVCNGGTDIDSMVTSFQVAGDHTVRLSYKCGDDVIKAETMLEGIRPLEWSDEITAPTIIGYSFTGWSAVDGVTLTDDDGTTTKTSSSEASIKLKAIYDGKLIANYSKKRIIYFNNTLNWSSVYVYFYSGGYWNDNDGTGAQTGGSYTGKYGEMTPIAEGSKIYYFDAQAAGVDASYTTVSFTELDQNGESHFGQTDGVNNKVSYHTDYYATKLPMFVPLAGVDPVKKNSNHADYYNNGYWMNYPENTGYTLKIYNQREQDGAIELKSIPFEFTENKTMPMELDVDLEEGKIYGFKIWRNDGLNTGAGSFYGNGGNMTANTEGWDMKTDKANCGLQTTAAGNYKFILNFYAVNSDYQYRVSVTYPVAVGDYRLLYNDNVQNKVFKSAIIPKAKDKDTVSFFVRKGQSATLKLQKCTGLAAGTATWTDTVTWWSGSTIHSNVKRDSVYNICLKHNASGRLEIENVEMYSGNYYIRTDAANSKWDNYRTDPDHLMTYSEYSITHGGYSHYYTHWVEASDDNRKNIKFCIANDYSPSISDTLTRESNTAPGWGNINNYIDASGNILRDANVRFMWNINTNAISRAYVDGAQGDNSSNFLYILNTDSPSDKIRWSAESALTNHKVTFMDNGNWIYEANIQAQPNAQIRLLSNWGESNTITQYFKGSSSTTEALVGGSGTTWYDIRVIYDFKTNRLLASYIPSGNVTSNIEINADVMFIREHHGNIAQLTFGESGKISEIKTAYGVLRLNKYILNNKDKSTHEPLESPKSRYERDLFYVSFPFRVAMEDVFGFGTYGTHWIIEYYDGATRAANGYWAESGPNWKFIWDRKNKFFEPNQGYIIALELDELGESSGVWDNTDQVELYFPSYGTMADIKNATVNCTIPEHLCTINRSNESNGHGGTLGPQYDRRVKDSHWNVISVPTYVNTENPTFANTDWITTATETSLGPNFLYEWNPDDNSVTARSGAGYTYQAMHAYLVQYCGVITWTSSVSSPAVAARRNPAYRGDIEFRLQMMQNEEMIDQTFVKLSDDEAVTTGFEFNYDLSKEFNKTRSNIYTLIGAEPVAGNVLPLTDQTTVIPVGVTAKTSGEYTFAIPEGTEGVGVTLIDNESGARTSLSALEYSIYLTAGEHNDRFMLEISPISSMPTGVEEVTGDGLQVTGVRKVIIDGVMYIIRDGKMYDARGLRVE